MKKTLLLLMMIFAATISAQRLKTPYKAIDNETYKVGDMIKINHPTNNGFFQTIFYTDRVSAADVGNTLLQVMGSTAANPTTQIKTQYSDEKVSGFSGKIQFFRKEQADKVNIVFAYVPYTDEVFLKIALDVALGLGEVDSKNPKYKSAKFLENSAADNLAESNMQNLSFTVVGAYGNDSERFVSLEFTVTNNSTFPQTIILNYNTDSVMTDFEGKTYKSNNVILGGENRTQYIAVDVPAGIKMKAKITYPSVLENIQKISVATIYGKSSRAGAYTEMKDGFINLKNIPVKWNSSSVNQSSVNGGYDLKLYDQNLILDNVSAKGNSKTQKVLIEYTLQNKSANLQLCIENPYAIDSEGNTFDKSKALLGQGSNCALLPTDIKVKGFIELDSIPKTVEKLEYINIPVTVSGNGNYKTGNNEIRNLKITWD